MFTKVLILCVIVGACARRYPRDANPDPSALGGNDDTMDRQKRGTDQENSLWGNPCTESTVSKSVYTPKYAEKVERQATYALSEAQKYKDELASKLFTVSTFDALSSSFSGKDFLRATPWFREEVLPKEKVLGQKLSDDAMSVLMEKIDEVLPSMYKGLKMVVAGLNVFTENLSKSEIRTDANLVKKLNDTVSQVQSVLCVFFDLMVARNLKIEPLLDSEIPKLNDENLLAEAFPIYRDTLTYLDYLAQVFETMAKTNK